MDIKRDDYIFIDIEWKSGFKHTAFCRGFNLQSHIKFNESIFWIKKFTWRVVSEKEYNAKLWPTIEENEDERGKRKSKTLKEAPAKRDSRTKAGKDSKAVRKPQRASKPAAKRATSSSKEARTELREPKVRNVRKPKKDVQGTDNSGKATLPRTRSRKAKTQ